MRSVGDLTAAALIRNAAMRLFADRSAAAVTVRDIAAEAGVSPALVIHHYKSKDGLTAAVQAWAMHTLTELTNEFATPSTTRPAEVVTMAERFTQRLEAHPDLLAYLRRLMVDGGGPAEELFRSLYELSVAGLAESEAAGTVRPSDDPIVRAAFLLVNDLGVIVLREQIAAVLGSDPLSSEGIARWTRQLMDVYTHGIFAPGKEEPHT